MTINTAEKNTHLLNTVKRDESAEFYFFVIFYKIS